METITWKNSDLSGVRFDFENNNQTFGILTLNSEMSSNANFTTDNDRLQFKRVGFWDNKILIRKNDKLIGEIGNRLIGRTFLKFKTGRTFKLSSNIMGRNLKWLSSEGQPIVEYTMATLNSTRKGFIKVNDNLPHDEKEVLLSAGLIAGRFNTYRLTFGLFFLAFLFYMISKSI